MLAEQRFRRLDASEKLPQVYLEFGLRQEKEREPQPSKKRCRGQSMDISFVDGRSLGVPEYMDMVRGKTATLFGAACEVAAIIAWCDDRTVQLARDFGLNMGIAFQIHDDYLGIWGDEDEVGKTANDLAEKKRTLPVVLALEMARLEAVSWC